MSSLLIIFFLNIPSDTSFRLIDNRILDFISNVEFINFPYSSNCIPLNVTVIILNFI